MFADVGVMEAVVAFVDVNVLGASVVRDRVAGVKAFGSGGGWCRGSHRVRSWCGSR